MRLITGLQRKIIMKTKENKIDPSLEKIKHYAGELPQSDFYHSNYLKWKEDDQEEFLSPAKVYSDVLGVYWEIDLDIDMRLALYLNGMRVGAGSYVYPSIPRVLAERVEDSIRKDISAYLKMLDIIELSKNLK